MNMLVYLYSKCHLQTLIVKHRNLYNLSHCLITPTPIIRTTSYTTQSIIPTNVDSSEFKISFLKNNCGLSGKALDNACKYLNFDSSDQRPPLILEFLRNFGFQQPNITRIISCVPRILQYFYPEMLLKPKLDFLLSMDLSQAVVVDIVTRNPRIFTRSLNSHLIPSFNQLNTIIGCNLNAVALVECSPCVLTETTSILSNIKFLRTHGIPVSQILKIARHRCLMLYNPCDKFRKVVLKVMDMDFDLSSSYFIHALRALSFHKNSTWESRCVLLKSFGFSSKEVLSMFKKLPVIMSYKESCINEMMEFFLKKLHWTPFRLSSNPAVLTYSLTKRTIPRCSVMQVMVLKNITSESYMLTTILAMTERKFVKDFVTAHKDEFPDVMEAYQGKLKFDEYTFKQKEQLNLKTSCID